MFEVVLIAFVGSFPEPNKVELWRTCFEYHLEARHKMHAYFLVTYIELNASLVKQTLLRLCKHFETWSNLGSC